MSASHDLAALVRHYWAAAVARDWAAFGDTVHPDVVYRVPQTREVVKGRADYVEFNRTYPGDWQLDVVSVAAGPGQAVSRCNFTVNGDTAVGISFFAFDDAGLITAIDDFWPEAYEPPVRMTTVVQRY